MSGTLHIFRLKSDPEEYQVNYNIGANSWVQVVDPTELDHFLRHASAVPPDEVDELWKELRATGHTTESVVHIAEAHLAEMGFAESPSDE
jgi:hypothetical protein